MQKNEKNGILWGGKDLVKWFKLSDKCTDQKKMK